jgi:hypothetical protein
MTKSKELMELMKRVGEFMGGNDLDEVFEKLEFKEEKGVISVKLSEDKWSNLPKGWTKDSLKSFWGSLTGDHKHKVSACIAKMKGKMDDPGAFCGGLASKLGKR